MKSLIVKLVFIYVLYLIWDFCLGSCLLYPGLQWFISRVETFCWKFSMKRSWMSLIFSSIGPLVITEKFTQWGPIRSPMLRKVDPIVPFNGKPRTKIWTHSARFVHKQLFSRDSNQLIEYSRPLWHLYSTNPQSYRLFWSFETKNRKLNEPNLLKIGLIQLFC